MMINERRPYTYELAIALLVMIGIAGFGIANWNSYIVPPVPVFCSDTHPDTIAYSLQVHERKIEDVGKDAAIPWAYCMPITFIGFFGAIVCVVWIIERDLMP